MKAAPLALLLLAACGADRQADVATGPAPESGDVRSALIAASGTLADTSAYRGRPADAARAAAQVEMLANAFVRDPDWSAEASATTLNAMRQARTEMRSHLGIRPDASPAAAEAALRRAASALDAGNRAGAQAALAPPVFVTGGSDAVARLSNLPRMPRVAEAASQAQVALWDHDRNRRAD